MRRRAPRRLLKAGSEPRYLAWVRTLPCLIANTCWGGTHAHHAIHLSQGGTDADAIPLCMRHHAHWHNPISGVFKGWSKMERWAWSLTQIAGIRARYAAVAA